MVSVSENGTHSSNVMVKPDRLINHYPNPQSSFTYWIKWCVKIAIKKLKKKYNTNKIGSIFIIQIKWQMYIVKKIKNIHMLSISFWGLKIVDVHEHFAVLLSLAQKLFLLEQFTNYII